MTPVKKCPTPEECDKKYILTIVFWRSIAMLLFGGIAIVFATGKLVQRQESTVLNHEIRISDIERDRVNTKSLNEKLDTLINRTKPK